MARRSPCVLALQQSADGEAQTLTEVDLFISTQRIKVLNADSQVSVKQHTHGARVNLHCVVFSSPFISPPLRNLPGFSGILPWSKDVHGRLWCVGLSKMKSYKSTPSEKV